VRQDRRGNRPQLIDIQRLHPPHRDQEQQRIDEPGSQPLQHGTVGPFCAGLDLQMPHIYEVEGMPPIGDDAQAIAAQLLPRRDTIAPFFTEEYHPLRAQARYLSDTSY
jgi:hypothetical protein